MALIFDGARSTKSVGVLFEVINSIAICINEHASKIGFY